MSAIKINEDYYYYYERDLANWSKPAQHTQHIQKAWDGLVAANHRKSILSRAPCDVDKARLLAVVSTHAGD